MKTLKYLIVALAVAFALAGCAGGSGSANFDSTNEGPLQIDSAYTN